MQTGSTWQAAQGVVMQQHSGKVEMEIKLTLSQGCCSACFADSLWDASTIRSLACTSSGESHV